MSSKSRKQSRQAAKKRQHPGGRASTAVEEARPPVEDEDELVHVPKDTNRLRFLLIIALMVVLLIIFIVPGAIMNAVRGGRPDEVGPFVAWNDLDGSSVEMTANEWTLEKRNLSTAFDVSPFLKFAMGFSERTISDEELARFLILERMALQAGIEVPDADLAAHLKQVLDTFFRGSRADYDRIVAARGGAPFVEASLRRGLRVLRYLQVVSYFGAVPDPATIEEAWARDHEEFAFDFTSLEVATLVAEARAEVPSDEELETWFQGLEPFRTRSLMRPERRAAEVAVFRPGETASDELLARFPAPEGVEPEERAKQYYDRVFYLLFRKPPEEDASEEQAQRQATYYPFEEVKERCLAEAPVYFAMNDWLSELRGSSLVEGAPEVDLAASASELGLAHETTEGPVTRDELSAMEAEKVTGDSFANTVFQAPPGQLGASVVVRDGSFSIVHVTERIEPSLPPLEEIHDEVVDMWARDRAQELALERLGSIRDGLATEPPGGSADDEETEGETPPEEGEDGAEDVRYADSEGFRSTVEAAGLTADWRDWLDKGAKTFAAPGLEPRVNDFFRSHPEYYELEDAQVPEPALDGASEFAYLVRLAGRRPFGIEHLSPADYDRYKSQSAMQARSTLLQEPSYEFLAQHYGIRFSRQEPKDEEPMDEEQGGE